MRHRSVTFVKHPLPRNKPASTIPKSRSSLHLAKGHWWVSEYHFHTVIGRTFLAELKSEPCCSHGRGRRTLFMKSWYLVSSVLGNDLVEVLINVHIFPSKKGKVWNTFYWRKPDQLLALYVSRLLLPKPMLLCFKRRLKEHKRHPKLHSENTAKLTQALYFYLACPTSLLWRAFSKSTPYMVILHENLKLSQYFGPFKDIFSDRTLSSMVCKWQKQHLFWLSEEDCKLLIFT